MTQRVRWAKHQNNEQCKLAIERSRIATRGRGRKPHGSFLASKDTRYSPKLGSMTFEEFCEDQRIRIMNSLRPPIDDQLRYLTGEHPLEARNMGSLPIHQYDYERRR